MVKKNFNGQNSVATSANEIVEQINKDNQMTKERVSKIIAKILEVDTNNDPWNETEYDKKNNRIYSKTVNGFDCYVVKGFEIDFSFYLTFRMENKESNFDQNATVFVNSLADLYGAVAIIAHFDKDPFDTIASLNSRKNKEA